MLIRVRGLVFTVVCAATLLACQSLLDFGQKSGDAGVIVIYVGPDGGSEREAAAADAASDATDASDASASDAACGTGCAPELLRTQAGLFGVAVDDTTIYVSLYEQGQVWSFPIDPDAGAQKSHLGFTKPAHLAVDATSVYVGTDDGAASNVYRLDKKTLNVLNSYQCSGSCLGVAIGPNDVLAYTERAAGGTVHSGTNTLQSSTLQNPEGLAVAANGDVYVASPGNDSVFLWPSDGGSLTAAGAIASPAGVAVDESSWWATSQVDGGAIFRGTLGVAGATALSPPVERPTGIAVTKSAIYFVTRPNGATPALWRLAR